MCVGVRYACLSIALRTRGWEVVGWDMRGNGMDVMWQMLCF